MVIFHVFPAKGKRFHHRQWQNSRHFVSPLLMTWTQVQFTRQRKRSVIVIFNPVQVKLKVTWRIVHQGPNSSDTYRPIRAVRFRTTTIEDNYCMCHLQSTSFSEPNTRFIVLQWQGIWRSQVKTCSYLTVTWERPHQIFFSQNSIYVKQAVNWRGDKCLRE